MVRKYGLKITTILLILLLSGVAAHTHFGRTDKKGGHYDRSTGEYHYHNRRVNGQVRYAPTQLEWLTLQLNAKYNIAAGGAKGTFQDNMGTDIITLEISYGPGTSIQQRNEMIDTMKEAVALEAERYGWQDWVKTEVRTESLSGEGSPD